LADLSVGPAEADALLAPLAGARGLVLAVSGGPDSLALLALVAEWAARRGRPPLFAVTVNHGLRAEAAAEADLVADVAGQWRVDHRTLVWSGPRPDVGLAEAAREARYRLLKAAARTTRCSHVVTAHHLDDQAETVLMRLAAGSGIDGLAAMRPVDDLGDAIKLARPFLGIPKARLVATCAARGLPATDDPTNRDLARPRPRLRASAAALAREGLTPERLGRLARRAARASDALRKISAAALARAGWSVAGQAGAAARWQDLAGEPEEVRLRCLVSTFDTLLPADRRPRLRQVEALLARLDAAEGGDRPVRATLAGLAVTLRGDGTLDIRPAPPRRSGLSTHRAP
jgi:tRNA(Ile)-lysidine synthase